MTNDIGSDLEEQLMVELEALAKGRKENREQMEEKLYLLHAEMKGKGRDGKFTPFLHARMGWSVRKPYDKAMRWIASYERRVGLITQDEYLRRTGKPLRTGSTPPGGASKKIILGVRPATPVMTQEFTVIDGETTADEPLVAYTSEDLEANAEELTRRHPNAVVCELPKDDDGDTFRRAVATLGERDYYKECYEWSLKTQMRRHGVKTEKEVKRKLAFVGLKLADDNDDWGQMVDEIFRDIDRYPSVANSSKTEEEN